MFTRAESACLLLLRLVSVLLSMNFGALFPDMKLKQDFSKHVQVCGSSEFFCHTFMCRLRAAFTQGKAWGKS